MKRFLILTLAFLLACLPTSMLAACSAKPSQFSVTMSESYTAHDPITLTVTLPNNAKESDITFAVNGTVYSVASMPTVNDPTFVFADVADDGMQSVRLTLASDESEYAVLYMLPDADTEDVELCFFADMDDFSPLTDYLGSN